MEVPIKKPIPAKQKHMPIQVPMSRSSGTSAATTVVGRDTTAPETNP
ncbi:hypothetical protein NHJ6243_002181 [Beauveria neobassiana]